MHHKDRFHTIVCIGTSTGGPRALQSVLEKLPADIQAPIVIVQHMPPKFTKSLANRLDALCRIHVKEAEDGETLCKGTAYIAPGGKHMSLQSQEKQLHIKIDDTAPVNGHRPSVDVLFQSINQIANYRKVAVIMTGMGSDGKQGVKALKNDSNTFVIAESKQTCIVYGMPKAIIEAELADSIKELDEIAINIINSIE